MSDAETVATTAVVSPITDRLAAALAYAARGWRVIPVHYPEAGGCSCGNAACRSPGKHPLLSDWTRQATLDIETITRWWAIWPEANVGIVLGDGLIDIECDPRHGGDSSMPQLEQRIEPLPDTVTWISGGGGAHRIFRIPRDVHIGNAASIGRDLLDVSAHQTTGIDVRGAGGFAVAPPSRHASGNAYRFGTLHPDALEVADLPIGWLDYLTARPVQVAATANAEVIPSGFRNQSVTRLAGLMRRGGLTAHEMLPSLMQYNTQRCQPPMETSEVEQIARSVARYAPDQVTVAMVNCWPEQVFGDHAHHPPSVGDLCDAKPALRPSLINGILRQGETMNVIAAPKVGKSWLVTDLALAVATGRPWLGYGTERRDVLILDNELHGETSANRIPRVATARGIEPADYRGQVFVENLRGRLTDLFSMASYFDRIPVGRYGLIVLDAFYRFLPSGSDENDNGTMASLYNAIDRHAERLGCSFALIHHSSKGSQSSKAVTDVGSGAGAQSRATDTHLVLRPHEETDAVVLDAAVRSWPPLTPHVLRWDFPVWNLATDLDPTQLRKERPRRERSISVPDGAEPARMGVEDFAARFITSEPQPRSAILTAAVSAGISLRRAGMLLGAAEQAKLVHRWKGAANTPQLFATVAPPLHEP